MKYWYLLLLFILFATNQVLELIGLRVPFLHSYLDDILFFPLVFGIATIIVRKATRNEITQLPLSWVFISFTILSILFEVIYPQLSKKFTGDLYDFFAYLAGLLIYFVLCRSGNKKQG